MSGLVVAQEAMAAAEVAEMASIKRLSLQMFAEAFAQLAGYLYSVTLLTCIQHASC